MARYRTVNLEPPGYAHLQRLQKDIEKATGFSPNLGQVVERALQCLEDAQRGGAWLSPKEAAPRFEERHQREIMSIIAQLFAARILPERSLQRVDFDRANNQLVVWTAEGDEHRLFCVKEPVTDASGVGSGGTR